MSEKEIYREIGRRIMDPNHVQYLYGYKDEYGDDMFDKLMSKCRPAVDTAWRFGFDENRVKWLLTLRDLAWKRCLEIVRNSEDEAEEPAKYMAKAADEVTRQLLSGLEGNEVEEVIAAAVRVAEGKDASPEEKIACIVQEVYDHADQIADQGVRSLYRFEYVAHQYQDKVCEAGKLVDFEPHDFVAAGIELREKIG